MIDKQKTEMDLIRELSELEKQLENTKQLLDLKDHQIMNIFSNLSHELRTPLNGIIGFAELLSTSELTVDEIKLYSGVIVESSNILMSILGDTYDLVKIESGRYQIYPEPFDLNNLIYELFMEYRPIAEKKNLQLFLENLISEELIIRTSPTELKKILVKLVENAIKYTKRGWIKIKYEVIGNTIFFTVEDSGIGINETVRSKLFQSFTAEEVSKSRNVSGTGLDLTLCSGLVNLLGGTIEYYPAKDQGSVFQFSIINHKR